MTAPVIRPGAPPDRLILDRAAVGRLNFQPRICRRPLPCIASRRGDVLELVFHVPYDALSGRLTGTRYRYRLEEHGEKTVVAVRISE